MKIEFLRKKYPKFIYQKYSFKISKKDLEISFNFKIKPNLNFKSKVIIKGIDGSQIEKLEKEVLNNLIFNLGLIEMLSYWKVTCSPKIEIKAGSLNQEQIKWWKDLIINGMGQFFYENKINFKEPDFLKISSKPVKAGSLATFQEKLNGEILVPIGGGKDSIVTLEILKRAKKDILCFSLNPTDAAKRVIKIAGCKKIIIQRKIDKRLFKLNQEDFLNGHTPFSAYLAFSSVLTAIIFGQKYIAFSNEKSSNEGNLKYLEKVINHQYSKSFDFEKKFRKYSKKYLAKNIEYFSFLRPLYEIQISKLFTKYHNYFSSFISCNEAFKTNSGRKKPLKKWCLRCPKCLFIFASLYPFLDKYRLYEIFEENLFKKISFLPTMLELIGEEGFKPFECIGTKKESQIAFYLSWRKNKTKKKPFLLKHFEKKILKKYPNLKKESKKILTSWDSHNSLPKEFEKILKKTVES